PGHVAKRFRKTLASPAGGLSVRFWLRNDSGDDRRGAGTVHLRNLLTMDRFYDMLACPACSGKLRTNLACGGCGAMFEAPDGIPDLRLAGGAPSEDSTDAVRRFYEAVPFPGYPPRDSLHTLRARAERSKFTRLLDEAIPGDARIVDVGCGTGQMSLYLAHADRLVIGADLSRPSLQLGASAAG